MTREYYFYQDLDGAFLIKSELRFENEIVALPPTDMKVGCLGLPCESGTCEVTPDGGYKCKCFPGFKGRHCFGGIRKNFNRPVLLAFS